MTLHEVRQYLDRVRAFADALPHQRPEMLRVLEAAEHGWSHESAKVSELILELQELRAWRQKVLSTLLGVDDIVGLSERGNHRALRHRELDAAKRFEAIIRRSTPATTSHMKSDRPAEPECGPGKVYYGLDPEQAGLRRAA